MRKEIKEEFSEGISSGKGKFFSSRIFLFFLLLALIWLSLILTNTTYKRYQMIKEINDLKNEISQLKTDNQDLVNLLDSFNNQSFLEKEARRRLNLKKEGEIVVVLPKTETGATFQAQEQEIKEENSSQNEKEESNLSKWWRYFFKN